MNRPRWPRLLLLALIPSVLAAAIYGRMGEGGAAPAEAGGAAQAAAKPMTAQQLQACGRARQELLTLQRGRAFRYDENGNPAYLDDAAVQAETQRLQAFIEGACEGTPEQLERQQAEADRFAAQQAIEDRCVRARQRLALLEKPESRTSASDLATARREAEQWCAGATGDRTIILRRQAFIR